MPVYKKLIDNYLANSGLSLVNVFTSEYMWPIIFFNYCYVKDKIIIKKIDNDIP